MNNTATSNINELRDAITDFLHHESSQHHKDKTTKINHCTAALIYFTQEGFTRDQIRDEVVKLVC